ncbi:PilN domain-containing protein [Sporosarcina sp. UB5]|uniref:PilN domain-containing protein n=1 Tax=Sporosarcina sp. UB5 TaxID=3047463 RepID=UPI003D78B3AD
MLVDINLLPEKERERSTLLIAALVILSAAILFWASLFMLSLSLKKETVHVEGQIAALHASQEAIRENIKLSTHADDREKLASTVEWAEAYRFNTLPLLRDLVALLPERGFFVSFEFTAPHESTVVVQFDHQSEAAYYLTRVKSSGIVSAATLQSVVAHRLDDESVDALPRFEASYSITYVDERSAVVDADEMIETDGQEDGSDE